MDIRRFQARPAIKFGCFTMNGGRDYQEDRITALPDVNYSGLGYFAVFDGHGGSFVSDYLCRNFHLQLSLHSLFKYQPLVALDEVWKAYDDRLFDACHRHELDTGLEFFPVDGSTATVCVIQQDFVHITNCGDSAAFVVYSDGHAEMVTEEHGTLNDEEAERCIQAGAQLLTIQEFVKLQAQIYAQAKQQEQLINAGSVDEGDTNKTSVNNKNKNQFGGTGSGGFLDLFALCCTGAFISNNVVSPNIPGQSISNSTNNENQPKSNRSNTSNRSNNSSHRQQLKRMLKGGGSSSRNKIKKRVFPGGLLVTRSFGDFYGKREHLGGIKGGIIADHGKVKSIDMRKEKVKYIILASDGIWDALQVDYIISLVENRSGNVNKINSNNNQQNPLTSSGSTSSGTGGGSSVITTTTTISSIEDGPPRTGSPLGKGLSAVLPESAMSPPNSARSGTSLA